MNIILRTTKKEEVEYLQKMKREAYSINKKYFEDGILPGSIDNIDSLYQDTEYELFTIYLNDEIVGSLAVKEIETNTMQIDSFFIAKEYQGKNLGSKALAKVEHIYPNTNTWRLVTPTQLMKNIVFYVHLKTREQIGINIPVEDMWEYEFEWKNNSNTS